MRSIDFLPAAFQRSRWVRGAIAACFMLLLPASARCEYLLHPGDVVSVSTIGSDDLKQTAMIRNDGNVFLALIGEVKAAGLSVDQLRSRVISILATKVLRRRTADGREFPVVISADQLNLTIAEYSPIYIMGDVAKPGEKKFRPGITVRQAIALAGGYDVMRFRMQNPFLDSADLRGQYESLWAEFAQYQADALRIKTELAGGTELSQKSVLNLPIAPPVSQRIMGLEEKLLASRNDDNEKEIAGLKNGIAQESKRIAALGELEAKEAEGGQADKAEYDRLDQAYKKGTVPVTRVSEMRRMILLSSTRQLQTTVQRYDVERQQQELSRKLQKYRAERKIKLLKELQETELKIAKARSLLQATGEKLAYTSMVKSQLVRGKGSKPGLVIHRIDGTTIGAGTVSEDSQLQPGDVLEVALHVAPLAAPAAKLTTGSAGKIIGHEFE
jgi:polysaccharide export outer membrane protein